MKNNKLLLSIVVVILIWVSLEALAIRRYSDSKDKVMGVQVFT